MEKFKLTFLKYEDNGKTVVMVNVETNEEFRMSNDTYLARFDRFVEVTVKSL